uniref:Uncharacterized protein n=1 Tax=uncultured Bacteroidota bacterium TaxID=152509 RepID=H5SNW8_9BACT|nr:hypothetical protein HGMM_F52E02C37 [uncultured Bacteroidetes bacterium]
MESLRITRVRRLAQEGATSIALTAYLPVGGEEVLSPARLGKVQEKAEKSAAKLPDVREAESFRANLEHAIRLALEGGYSDGTWLLAVTPSLSEAIFLPFALPEEIAVGKNLKPHAALYALYKSETLFVGFVSEQTTRWFEAVGERLFPLELPPAIKEALSQLHKARHQLQSLTVDNSHYTELFSQMARSAYSIALVKYTDALREAIRFYLEEEKVRVVLMGEERILQEVSRGLEGKGTLAVMNTILDASATEAIAQQVQLYRDQRRRELEEMYLPFLEYCEPQSPQEIWELLQEASGGAPILFVEEGYSLPADQLAGSKRSLPTREGLDLLIGAVRDRGGEVLFFPPGKLPQPLTLLLP